MTNARETPPATHCFVNVISKRAYGNVSAIQLRVERRGSRVDLLLIWESLLGVLEALCGSKKP
jgi:hypothetical protein